MESVYNLCVIMQGLGQGDKYSDKCLDVYKYFNTSCFTGFSDDQLVCISLVESFFFKFLSYNIYESLDGRTL